MIIIFLRSAIADPREYPIAFGLHFASLIPRLIATAGSIPDAKDEEFANFDEKDFFASLKFTDLWEDASMVDLVVYLKGNRSLCIPAEWRHVIPSKIKLEK